MLFCLISCTILATVTMFLCLFVVLSDKTVNWKPFCWFHLFVTVWKVSFVYTIFLFCFSNNSRNNDRMPQSLHTTWMIFPFIFIQYHNGEYFAYACRETRSICIRNKSLYTKLQLNNLFHYLLSKRWTCCCKCS